LIFLLLEVRELSTTQLSSYEIGFDRCCPRIGGTAGCILASRLSQADPSLSILVVEGGKNNFNDPTVTNPAVFLGHLAPDSKNAIFYKGKKSDKLGGRAPIVPTGGILGGGSSINFMM
jgi:choline dehydrogenase-like flavoprotein